MPFRPYSGEVKRGDPPPVMFSPDELAQNQQDDASPRNIPDITNEIRQAKTPMARKVLLDEYNRVKFAQGVTPAATQPASESAPPPPQVRLRPYTGAVINEPKQAAIEPPNALVRLGAGFNDLYEGGKQIVNEVTGNDQALAEQRARVADNEAIYQRGRGPDAGIDYMRGLGQALPAMAIPGAAATLPGVMGLGAVGGAVTGGLKYKQDGESRGYNALTDAVGGAVGGAVGQAVGKYAVAPLARRAGDLLRREPARPSGLEPVIDNAATPRSAIRAPVDMGEGLPNVFRGKGSIDPEIKKYVDAGVMTAEQAQRMQHFKDIGVNPSVGQVTREFPQQQFERSMQGNNEMGAPVREGMDMANRAMTGSVQDFGAKLGAKAQSDYARGDSVINTLTKRFEESHAAVGDLYSVVRAKHGDKFGLTPESMVKVLQDEAPNYPAIKAAYETAVNHLQKTRSVGQGSKLFQTPLVDKLGNLLETDKTIPGLTINQAESLRSTFGELASQSGNNLTAQRFYLKMQGALDDDVSKGAGIDAFKQARAESRKYYQELENPYVKRVMDEKIAPEHLADRYIKGGTVNELSGLKKVLISGTKDQINRGTEAWNNLRASVADDLLQSATKNGYPNSLGDQVFSGQAFKKAMDAYPPEKLKVLFSPQELAELNKIKYVSDARIPIGGTINPSGSGNAIINHLETTGLNVMPSGTFRFLHGLYKIGKDASAKSKMQDEAIMAMNPGKYFDSKIAAKKAMPIPSNGLLNPFEVVPRAYGGYGGLLLNDSRE